MSKIDVNNEIVLMRHSVRRARLYIVRKLIKQVKQLRLKKGDDKQREKYKRKADKMGQELTAIKKIADDEISRYALTNERSLQEILADVKWDAETCVLARLAHNKIIKDRVAEFKQKFPNYKEHLGPGKRKLIKLKRKAGKQAKKEAKLMGADTAKISDPEEAEKGDSDDNGEPTQRREDITESLSENDGENEPDSTETVINNGDKVARSCSDDKRTKTETKILSKTVKEREIKSGKSKPDKLSGISATSKEGTVKRFASFLEENDADNSAALETENESQLVLEKEVDSFFMTEDGDGEYLSVVVPKSNVTDEDEETEPGNAKEWNSAKSRNNKFFDKVERVERPRQTNSRDNNSFGKGERFKDRNRSRDASKGVDIRGGKRPRTDFGNGEKSGNDKMHPSWAAKKKEQEILKLGFQGKKIVFDDV